LGIRGGRSIAAWVGAVWLGFALFGLVAGAAQAQTVTEFSAGITGGARPYGITAGPDGNLWFTELDGNRIGRISTAPVFIPTLSDWAKFALSGLLLLAGVVVLRWRRKG
jgi:hypothetical protein